MGETPGAYLASLKACRTFCYQQGSISLLDKLLKAGTFTADPEDDHCVVINSAGLAITRQPANGAPSQAPDHLMRLFALNDILRRAGPRLLMGPVQDSSIIEEAKQAYVVSPVSSLVVLETQQDYDRFGITGSKNSLQNASLKSKGAVPEPQEWALIILVVGLLLYARFVSTPTLKTQA
ncbi:XrtN system VIT domain protein [Chitinophaga costaii]|uniref:XrtN system VIT domain protein n=1 Tax=Chitinophaga costaii TaxID=1335309 RepID=A0A1C4EV83_9BACT|nr:hypothetical protein [Chitinophaga costaii]PUZ21630.1 hypothetical protein DCM91_16490 [Chitinophaga costaii]SCC47443.1 XrtN system VIT domain protein [Chitinophaga costaii]